MRIAILLGSSSDNANIDAEKLIEFETQLASVRITVFFRCLFHDVIIDLESRLAAARRETRSTTTRALNSVCSGRTRSTLAVFVKWIHARGDFTQIPINL